VLRLHVSGEAGIFFRDHVGSLQITAAEHADGIAVVRSLHSDFCKFQKQSFKVMRLAACDIEIAPRKSGSDDEGSSLNAIRNDAMASTVQLADALDVNGGSSRTLNVCAHLVEQVGEIGDFRLAGAILHDGFAFGEGGRHENVFRAGDGDLVENNFSASQAL